MSTTLVLTSRRLLQEHLEMKITSAQQAGRFFSRIIRVVVYFVLYVLEISGPGTKYVTPKNVHMHFLQEE